MADYKLRVICICHVIPPGHSYAGAASFAERVGILQQYVDVVLSSIPDVFCWVYRAFSHTGKVPIFLIASSLTQTVNTIYIVVTWVLFLPGQGGT